MSGCRSREDDSVFNRFIGEDPDEGRLKEDEPTTPSSIELPIILSIIYIVVA